MGYKKYIKKDFLFKCTKLSELFVSKICLKQENWHSEHLSYAQKSTSLFPTTTKVYLERGGALCLTINTSLVWCVIVMIEPSVLQTLFSLLQSRFLSQMCSYGAVLFYTANHWGWLPVSVTEQHRFRGSPRCLLWTVALWFRPLGEM